MRQKICVISFDHWNYDYHIANAISNLGHEGTHIKIGNFKHKSFLDKITNTLSKIFLGKNLKKTRRQDYILECLRSMGPQDQILVINPEVIDLKHHKAIKRFTKKYIAYLYDSVARNPVDNLLEGVFNTIFSFDKKDIRTYGFKHASNYIYLPKSIPEHKPKYDVVYVGSFDDRVHKLRELALFFNQNFINFKFLIIGNNKKLKHIKTKYNSFIEFKNQTISQQELIEYYKNSKAIIDLVRANQTGLSFRFFEALALHKKVITNNENVKDYDFYNTQNIHILSNDTNLELSFFESPYQFLENFTYEAFTIETWVKRVFEIERI